MCLMFHVKINNMPKKILMTGGGTLGPVTPLLALADALLALEPTVEISWIGTTHGPERALVESYHFPFFTLRATKLSRHEPWKWLSIPFLLIYSFIFSCFYLRRLRPDLVFTAGGYVSVPVVLAAWLFRIPIWVHQLDLIVGLANKIMAPFSNRVSVTWEQTAESFSFKKTTIVGGVVREALFLGNKDKALETYGLKADKPILLVIGGGTGAISLNEAMEVIAGDILPIAQVIHLTGQGKLTDTLANMGGGYVALEFLGEGMADVYAASDLVVARAGMGTITELSALGKPSILVPIQNTDQLNNAGLVQERGGAEVIWQMNPQILWQSISKLLKDEQRRQTLSRQMRRLFNSRGAQGVARAALELIEKK